MDFHGLLTKYKVNRKLSPEEVSRQLKQKQPQTVEPHYQLSVIEMNSSYLESVDKWFAWKGFLTSVSLVVFFTVVIGFGALAGKVLFDGVFGEFSAGDNRSVYIWNGVGMFAVFFLPSAAAVIWLLRKDSFAYTHYPMRFDRRNRMVHIYRTNATVLSVPWDDVFFTLGHMRQWDEWEIRGHILGADRVTIKETFALSYVGTLRHADRDIPDGRTSKDDFLRAHWEFIRRYMEEGPQSVSDHIQYCMPVSDRKETPAASFERVFANLSGAAVPIYMLMFPFLLAVGIGRVIAMRTSKIPLWPEQVLSTTAMESDDPYAIKGGVNGERIAVFPHSARAAGVRFKAPPTSTT